MVPHDFGPEPAELESLAEQARRDGRECVVSAVIVNDAGRAFVQRRSLDRRLFPGCWDLAGGHVEPGETLYAALAREVAEETGWRLVSVVALVHVFDWESLVNGETVRRREFDFLARVEGDLAHPQLERDKFTEGRWIGMNELDVLKENRQSGDDATYEIVRKGLQRK